MSHFTVMVKVKPERFEKHGNIKDAVDEMLAPYQENNMGDCPKEYLEFNDMTDEIEKDKNEIIEKDGYLAKEHPEWVGKTLLEAYGDFDSLATQYHCYKIDAETGKYGYWENSQRKWDWYQIGGRWSGLLRLKEGIKPVRGKRSWCNENEPDTPHTADVAKVKEIDLEGHALEADVKAQEFWNEYQTWKELSAKKDTLPEKERHEFWSLDHSIHYSLHQMGIRKCVQERKPVLDENGNQVMEPDPFPSHLSKDAEPRMVAKFTDPKFEDALFTLEDLKTRYRWFFDFSTFAVLDDDGWKEKGLMGWWGCSSDDADDRANWGATFFDRFIKDEDPETYVAIVDAHI